ncbi:MAG: polyamine ABC transporter ATP-binding protein [Rhodobacteraceae bacterium]|nr:polyamine ABC transporter ATP-binding protein [Paracoccaceae bacterium]
MTGGAVAPPGLGLDDMAAHLEIVGARKGFRTPEGGVMTALDGISLKLASAEFLTLLGPSGCGKTTLLRTISGFETLDEGDVLIDGVAVTQMPAHRRPVNTVFQRYALFNHMSVARNVGYALEIAGRDKRETRARVGEMLELVGLSGLGKRSVGQLSGGQQQRVALARALAGKPKLLLLDEPLSALDKNLRQKMQQELKAIQKELGIGFVFVTHDQEEALTMSDRIAVLAHGRIQQIDAPSVIYQRPANLFTADFLGDSNLLRVTLDGAHGRLADGQVFPADRGAGQATLMLRPEALGFEEPQGPKLWFTGRIGEVYYSGKDHQIALETESFGTIRALIRAGGQAPRVGDDLTLHAPATGLHLIDEVAP